MDIPPDIWNYFGFKIERGNLILPIHVMRCLEVELDTLYDYARFGRTENGGLFLEDASVVEFGFQVFDLYFDFEPGAPRTRENVGIWVVINGEEALDEEEEIIEILRNTSCYKEEERRKNDTRTDASKGAGRRKRK